MRHRSERLTRSRPPPVSRRTSDPGTPAEAYLRARGITGRLDWPALRYHPSVYYRADATTLRSKPGRRCLPPSPISTAISPASSAPGSIPAARPRRRSPTRAGRLGICSAMASVSAATDILAAGEGIETMLALKSVLPSCRWSPGSRPTTSPPSICRPGAAPPLCRPRQRRGRSQGGGHGCTNEAPPPASRSASSCPSTATSTSTSAVSAPLPCGTSGGSARPLRPDAFSARCPPLRSAAVSQSHFGSPVSRRKEERLSFAAAVCLGRKRSRASGLPERRSAGGDSRVAMAPANYFPPPPPTPSRRRMGTPLAGRLCIAKQNSCPAPSSAVLRPAQVGALRVQPVSAAGKGIAVKAAIGAADPPAERHPP